MEQAASTTTTFGPYYVRSVVAASEAAELSLAMLFVPDGAEPVVALRRVRGDHPRFIEHASRYAVLRHPGIVEVRDLGTIGDTSYVATEWVRGKSLLSALAACGRLGLGFPTDIALYLVTRALGALEYAHGFRGRSGARLGIVHGDLRHSNVLLQSDGTVKLADFELASASTQPRTSRGVCIGGRHGFFSYLAPEQVRDPGSADARADIFAMGVMLYELVTGRHLFSDANEDELLRRIESGQWELPIARYRPDLHPELESIVRTAVAPDPGDRFGSAGAFLDALSSFLGAVGVAPGPEGLRDLLERLFPAEGETEV